MGGCEPERILDANENDADVPRHTTIEMAARSRLMEYFTVYSYEPMTGTNINSRQDLQTLLENYFNEQRVTEILRNFPTVAELAEVEVQPNQVN